MKSLISLVSLVALCSCIGCKSAGKGLDILFDVNPLNRPMGQIRIQPVPDETVAGTRNSGVEVRFSLKRDHATIGKEDISIDVRIPGSQPVQHQESIESPVSTQSKSDLMPIPALLTAERK